MASDARSYNQLQQRFQQADLPMQNKCKRVLKFVPIEMVAHGVPPQIEQMKMDKRA